MSFLIMDADRTFKQFKTMELDSEAGQSLVEFLILLPLMIGMTVVIWRVMSAVQISVVNQKYLRGQTLFLTQNSPYYPRLSLRRGAGNLEATQSDQMVLGIAGEVVPEDAEGYTPTAVTQSIERPGSPQKGSNANGQEPRLRDRIRIRSTIGLCTQRNYILTTGGPVSTLDSRNIAENYMDQATFCRSPGAYEGG